MMKPSTTPSFLPFPAYDQARLPDRATIEAAVAAQALAPKQLHLEGDAAIDALVDGEDLARGSARLAARWAWRTRLELDGGPSAEGLIGERLTAEALHQADHLARLASAERSAWWPIWAAELAHEAEALIRAVGLREDWPNSEGEAAILLSGEEDTPTLPADRRAAAYLGHTFGQEGVAEGAQVLLAAQRRGRELHPDRRGLLWTFWAPFGGRWRYLGVLAVLLWRTRWREQYGRALENPAGPQLVVLQALADLLRPGGELVQGRGAGEVLRVSGGDVGALMTPPGMGREDARRHVEAMLADLGSVDAARLVLWVLRQVNFRTRARLSEPEMLRFGSWAEFAGELGTEHGRGKGSTWLARVVRLVRGLSCLRLRLSQGSPVRLWRLEELPGRLNRPGHVTLTVEPALRPYAVLAGVTRSRIAPVPELVEVTSRQTRGRAANLQMRLACLFASRAEEATRGLVIGEAERFHLARAAGFERGCPEAVWLALTQPAEGRPFLMETAGGRWTLGDPWAQAFIERRGRATRHGLIRRGRRQK